MRVIITGGSGLIGRALTARLTGDGYEVIVLSRSPARVRGLPDGARAVGWDARTAEGWGPLADGADAIVNLAGENLGEGRWTDEKKRKILDSRLNAARAVVEAVQAADAPPGVLVQASAVGYYGDHGDEALDEETPPGDDFLADVCVQWEGASQPVEDAGVRRVIVRSGIVLELEEGPLAKMLLPFRFFVGGPVGSGDQYVSWIHRDDEASALQFLMEHEGDEVSGPFNVCAPHPVTNEELSRTIGRVMGRPSFFRAPAFALEVALGEQSQVILDSIRAVPERLNGLGFEFEYPRIDSALRDILG